MPNVTYAEIGATAGEPPEGYRHLRVSRTIGRGRSDFERAADALLTGEVQRRAGADVTLSEVPLGTGTLVETRLRVGPLRFRAPCVVVWAERTATSCGFAYGTLPGHPEQGEERFVVELAPSGDVTFTITAFSTPARWFTRLGGPFARRVQTRMTARYLLSLDPSQRHRWRPHESSAARQMIARL